MQLKNWGLGLVILLFVFSHSSFGKCEGKNKELFIKYYKKALQEKDKQKIIQNLEKARQFCDVPVVNAYYFLLKAENLFEKQKKTGNISDIYTIRKYLYKAEMECQYINNKEILDNICPKINVFKDNLTKIKQNTFITEDIDDTVLKNAIAPSKGISVTGVNALIQFEFDSYKLTQKGEKLISKIASAITEVLRGISVVPSNKVKKITIIGYADTTGKASYNKWLSTKRAERVSKEFIEKYGFDKNIIEYWGEGEFFPICDEGEIIHDENGETHCSIKENKAKSRRVEIILHWKQQE